MENEKRVHWVLKTLLIIPGVIIILAAGFLIWLFFPVKAITAQKLIPGEAVAHISVKIDARDPGTAALLDRAKDYLFKRKFKSLRIPFTDQLIALFLPGEVTAVAAFREGAAMPDLECIVGLNSIAKLFAAADSIVDKALFSDARLTKAKAGGYSYKTVETVPGEISIAGYSVVGNSLVVATHPGLLQNSLTNYGNRTGGNRYLQQMAERITQPGPGFASVYLDNSGRGLSRLIAALETKTAFAASPTIDEIQYIAGSIELTPEALQGKITFACNSGKRIADVRSDVNFFYDAMRRLVRPYNMDLKGEIKTAGSMVYLDFNIENFITALFDYLAEEAFCRRGFFYCSTLIAAR